MSSTPMNHRRYGYLEGGEDYGCLYIVQHSIWNSSRPFLQIQQAWFICSCTATAYQWLMLKHPSVIMTKEGPRVSRGWKLQSRLTCQDRRQWLLINTIVAYTICELGLCRSSSRPLLSVLALPQDFWGILTPVEQPYNAIFVSRPSYLI